MKFHIENIGAIDEADLILNGITVLTGNNNTGKSTIAKACYTFLKDCKCWSDIYTRKVQKKTEQFLLQYSTSLEDYCLSVSGTGHRRTDKTRQLIEQYSKNGEFLSAIEAYQMKHESKKIIDTLSAFGLAYLRIYQKETEAEVKNYDSSFLNNWIQTILTPLSRLQMNELKLQTEVIQKSLDNVFHRQTRKIGTSQSALTFVDQGKAVTYSSSSNGATLNSPLHFANAVFVLESSNIYTTLSEAAYGTVQKQCLQALLTPDTPGLGQTSLKNKGLAVMKSSAPKNLKDEGSFLKVAKLLENKMGGKAYFLQNVGLVFKDHSLSEPIHASNLSAGLKALALLEYALRLGIFDENDILIIEEPENNLHPNWQTIYAEAVVLLAKECHMRFLITTHSPVFLRALECFSDLNGQMEHLNVYRTVKDPKHKQTVENLMYSEYGISDVYEDFSAPLEQLEKLLEKKYTPTY